MHLYIPLPDWDSQTWLDVGVVVYLLFSWLLFGPILARRVASRCFGFPLNPEDKFACFLVWLFSPVSVPAFCIGWVLFKVWMGTIGRFIYGKRYPF